MNALSPVPAPRRLGPDARAALMREDLTLIGKTFNVTADPRAVQANTRYMALLLRERGRDNRASLAAAHIEALIDTLMQSHVSGPIACGKGCSHCCNTFVSATIPEIFNLARAISATPARKARVLAAARMSQAIPQLMREANRIPCPMLEDHACSEYASRPVSCRYLLSTSLDTCLNFFVRGKPGQFQFADNVVTIRSYGIIMMKAALKLNGLPNQHYELNQGLAVALTLPHAEERWLAGEAVFSDVPLDRADAGPSPFNGLVDHLSDVLRPTL